MTSKRLLEEQRKKVMKYLWSLPNGTRITEHMVSPLAEMGIDVSDLKQGYPIPDWFLECLMERDKTGESK